MKMERVLNKMIPLVNIDKSIHSKKRFHVVAMVLDKKMNTLSIGFNSYIKTHPMQASLAKVCGLEDKVFLHAEIAALINCRKIPHIIVICRTNYRGELVNAKPCPICMAAFRKTEIQEIYYSSEDGWKYLEI
jgi:tRNA(Arg) A34 adenosine deaminase TadA